MSLKDDFLNRILEIEGEAFTNNPKDSGGPSKWGITEAVARELGYTGRMEDLTRSEAFAMLERRYWIPIQGDELVKLAPSIALEVADSGVNCGVSRAVKWLQRALNALNKEHTLYPDVVVDGHLGNKTLEALRAYLNVREVVVLHRALNALQGEHYVTLSERREKDETFVYGWFMHRVVPM